MKKFKTILVAAIAAFCSMTATAQDLTRNYPYGFVGVQGGGQAELSGYNFGDVLTGTGSVYGGAMWNPVLGTRLHVNGWQAKLGEPNMNALFNHKYINATVDLMTNLVAGFNHRDNNAVDLFLITGLGANRTFGTEWPVGTNVDFDPLLDDCFSFTGKVGLLANFNIARNWALGLEVDAYHHGGHNHGHELAAAKSWQLTGQLGVMYRFGKCKKAAPAPVPAPVEPVPEPVKEVIPAPAPAPAPVVVEEVKACIENVFFLINRYDIRLDEMKKVEAAVDYLNKYPKAKIEITGYADKNTGNATINRRLSQQRVNSVYNALLDRGIAADRIVKDYKGDSVQPFPNDEANYEKNRCVICVAE